MRSQLRPEAPVRPRAIALVADSPHSRRLAAWGAAVLLGLFVLLAVRDAAGREPREVAAPADVTLAEGQQVARGGGPPAGEESVLGRGAVPPRVAPRTPDRSRRAAGRAGVPVRRDGGGAAHALLVTASAPAAPTGGAAPLEAPAVEAPPLHGSHAYGVRGPPGVRLLAG